MGELAPLPYRWPMTSVTDAELDHLPRSWPERWTSYLADLEQIVNVDCGTYNKAGVDEIGRWFADQLEELGARVTIDSNESWATRLWACSRAAPTEAMRC